MRDAAGQVIRWCGIAIDVDERKRAEDATKSSESEFRLALDNIPSFVATLDANGELETVNRPLLEYFGQTLEDLRRWSTSDMVHPEDLPRVVAAWQRSVETGMPYESEQRLYRADGEYLWFHTRGRAVRDGEGRIVRWYNVMTEIDERRRVEEQLRRSEASLWETEARLAHAAQIAAVGELAASIAHEVNQPLAAVVTNGHACLRWLAGQPPNIAMAREAADRIVRDGKDAGEVIRRVRSLFTRAAAEHTAVDVNAVIREVLQILDIQLTRRSIAVECDLQDSLPSAAGDRVQCQQLVLNLVLNAIEAMEVVTNRPGTACVCARPACKSKQGGHEEVLVEIRDEAPVSKIRRRAFEPFFTTKKNGLGLGLAICRSIVEAHNGRLWATRGESFGTTLLFTLPLSAQPG